MSSICLNEKIVSHIPKQLYPVTLSLKLRAKKLGLKENNFPNLATLQCQEGKFHLG